MKLKERELWELSGDIGVQIGLNLNVNASDKMKENAEEKM